MRERRTHHNPFVPRYSGRTHRRRRRAALRPASVLRTLRLAALGAVLGGALYGATLAAHWATTSDRFRVKEIQVMGTREIPVCDIVQRAQAVRGTNIFRVPAGEIERAVEALPLVKLCTVERRLPDRIVVRVAERRPFFLFGCGTLWRVDREGVVLGPCRPGDLGRLFVAACEDDSWPTGGRGPAPAPGALLEPALVERITSTIAAVRKYAPDLAGEVSEICLAGDGEIVLFTNDPPQRVVFGAGTPRPESLVALGPVLGDLRRRGLTGMEIDMRFDRQLVARPRGSRAAMRDNS